MRIKINNDTDLHALAQIAGLQNPRSTLGVIAAYACHQSNDEEENFEAEVHKDMLPPTYQANPSLLALQLRAKTNYVDSSGHQTPGRSTYVTIKLLCERKPAFARYTMAQPSIKRTIKNWLHLNLRKSKKLKIEIEGIPPFFFSHPEQLKYQIKRETQTPIKITQLKKNWLISRK